MRIDILPYEAQWQEAAGDEPAVAPAVEAELVLVAVVGVAVELYDHPALDHQVHLADSLDLHSVLEAQARSLKVHSRQRLQRGTGPVTGAIESCERPSRAGAAQQVPNLLGSDPLIMKCCVKSDEWGVVLDVAAQETSQRLRERLNRVRGWRYTSPVPVCMEHLPPGSRESPAGRNDKMNLLSPLGYGQPVVAHCGLAGEEPSVNARQHNGVLSTRDTNNPMLIGNELTGPHQRVDVTALGASRLQVPHAHRSVAATNNGEQLSVHGVHGTHCRPAAEWAQPGRRRPVDNWRIRQAVASRTHRSVTDVLTQNCHPCPETQQPETSRPSSQGMVSKSDTKEPNNVSPSDTNRGIMRFCQTRSVLVAVFVSDLDTPHRSTALCTPGTTREAVRRHHRYPRSPGSGRDTPPTSPRHPVLLVDRHGVVGLARHRPTRWLDRVDDHAPTAWVHEHGYLSLPPFPTSIAAGQTRISHPASRPWAHVPTWILAAASLPGLCGIVRGITLWPDLPALPRRRAWLGWTQVALTVAFVTVCLVVAWPKA